MYYIQGKDPLPGQLGSVQNVQFSIMAKKTKEPIRSKRKKKGWIKVVDWLRTKVLRHNQIDQLAVYVDDIHEDIDEIRAEIEALKSKTK